MRTAHLDQIVRQKDPALLKAVEHLSNHETAVGIETLQEQGRITEIVDPQERITAIAKEYAAHPKNTLIISPDNASRRAINEAVRRELQSLGLVDTKDYSIRILTPRNDMTGADRKWANRYEPGDVLHYTRGSKEHGIEPRSYARVVTSDPKENVLTVRKEDGQQVTYDPSRLRGIAAYREIECEFAIADRIQFTAPSRDLQVANRDLGTIQSIGADGKISIRMDGTKDHVIRVDAAEMRHFDHGYAVTSHSSQGLTSERVIVNMDTEVHPELISSRFAYVSVSRASHEVQIYTDDAVRLAGSLSRDVSKASAISFSNAQNSSAAQGLRLAVR
jgi:ATP-dependent exoDNAse (exonuclease V) alpha subunit